MVGAGRVGSTLAYTLASSGVAREIVWPGGPADAAGAAVTVIAAGAAQREGESRPALLVRNVEVLRGIVVGVVRANPEGLLLIATNPVDALRFAALRRARQARCRGGRRP